MGGGFASQSCQTAFDQGNSSGDEAQPCAGGGRGGAHRGQTHSLCHSLGERLILGTTDTDYSGSLDEVHPDPADTAYLLGVAGEFFPQAALATKDIISSWAGLRPLLADGKGGASDISRAHRIRNPEPNWWDVAGGKLTTYRLMAEQTVDRLVAAAGLRAAKCRTASEPLLEKPDGFSGIFPPEFQREAVGHYCASEWALHLDDLMIRRTSWHYYHAESMDKARQAADWMSEFLGWPPPNGRPNWSDIVSRPAKIH